MAGAELALGAEPALGAELALGPEPALGVEPALGALDEPDDDPWWLDGELGAVLPPSGSVYC